MNRETFVVSQSLVSILGPARMAQLATVFDVQVGSATRDYRKRWRDGGDFANQRAVDMAELYRSGMTLEQIGQQYGLTRERVRQILKPTGTKKTDRGGVKEAAAARAAERSAKAAADNKRMLEKFGVTTSERHDVLSVNREMRRQGRGVYQTPTYAFTTQKNNAKRRGIHWGLSFAEWWAIWLASGKWDERGRGQYGLLRHGNTGPFVVGNVFVGKWKRGRGSWASMQNVQHFAEAAA